MTEISGAVMGVPCAKGCGHLVTLSPEQVELLRGVPVTPRIVHETCPGTEEPGLLPSRTFTVEVIVREGEDVLTTLHAEQDGTSFAASTDALGKRLGEVWAKVVEHAPIIDDERGDDDEPREIGNP